MVKRKKTRQRRRAFLLDSNQVQQQRKNPKTVRNRLLNTWFRMHIFRDLGRTVTPSRMFLALTLCMAGFIVFAVLSPYFDLKKININRDSPNIEVASIEAELQNFYGQNLLFLDKDLLRTQLKTAFPAFRTIEIKEDWPDALALDISLSPPAFTILNNADATFWVISEDGVMLTESAESDLPLIKLYDYEKPLAKGQRLVSVETLEKVILADRLMAQEFKIPIAERHLYPAALEVHLVAESGTQFWVDLQLDVLEQLKKIEYGASRMKLFSSPIEHVDLRIPNQLYWKPKVLQ